MRPERHLTSEEQLASAVMASGIEDACGAAGATVNQRLRRRAVKWMESDDELHLFGS